MIQGFKGHTRGHGTIPDNGNALAAGVLHPGGDCHAQCRADGCAGMTYAEGVVLALCPFREAGQASFTANAAHLFLATGQNLVGIGLVADVPY